MSEAIDRWVGKIHHGDVLDVLRQMPSDFVDCIITSPPYWGLRDYGVEGQIGLEPTLEEYLEKLLAVTAELKRVLKPTGVIFWNHGDNYSSGIAHSDWKVREDYPKELKTGGFCKFQASKGSFACKYIKPVPQKCMVLQNYRLILRMIDEQGWILRNVIIWHKPNCMPSSAKDRFTHAYEPVFMLVKSQKYWFDIDAVRVPQKSIDRQGKRNFRRGKDPDEQGKLVQRWTCRWNGIINLNPPGKNPGDVWTIPTQPFPEAHFATFPERLVEPMIKAACPRWICRRCGYARKRVTKDIGEKTWTDKRDKPNVCARGLSFGRTSQIVTLGWTDCGCDAGWRPGIVLDPFMGSGTVAVVAERLNRWWIGIEIKKEYIEMAYKRLSSVQKSLVADL